MKKEIFLEKARSKHGYKYKYPQLKDIITQKDIIYVSYNDTIYEQKVVKHLSGKCPEKTTKKKTTEEFIKSAIGVWGDKYDYTLTKYIDSRTKVKIIHNSIVYEQLPNSHLQYPVEGYLDGDVFIQKAKNIYGDKYDYGLVKFKNANTKVDILYNGIIYSQSPHNHLKYSPEKNIKRKTQEEFISTSCIIHDNKYNYSKVTYINDREKITIICPIHDEFKQTPNHHLKGVGCPSCNESKGEKLIAKILNLYKIDYKRQYRFSDCRSINMLIFDFYIPSKRMCIEFDGIQHFQPVEVFGGIEAYESTKIRDKIKSDYCEDNYINLVRIRYNQIDSVSNILSTYL